MIEIIGEIFVLESMKHVRFTCPYCHKTEYLKVEWDRENKKIRKKCQKKEKFFNIKIR